MTQQMTWDQYVDAFRAIPEAERRAKLAEFKEAISFRSDFCSDPRQRALTRERIEPKIRAIEESLA